MSNAAWIKTRVGDELGLSEDDLARMYSMTNDDLDSHLNQLADDPEAVVQRVISDIHAARNTPRTENVSDDQIDAARQLIAAYTFHPLIPLDAALGRAWRLSSDDAQWVAYRVADLIGLDFTASDVLRLRLHRLAFSYDPDAPDFDTVFRNRVADTALYLLELTGKI